jgi:hypothetical protein
VTLRERLKALFSDEPSRADAGAAAGSQASLLAMAEAAPCAVLISREGRLHYVNPAASAITGLRRDQLVGRPLLDLLHPDLRAWGSKRLSCDSIPLARAPAPRLLSPGIQTTDPSWEMGRSGGVASATLPTSSEAPMAAGAGSCAGELSEPGVCNETIPSTAARRKRSVISRTSPSGAQRRISATIARWRSIFN